MATHVLPCEPVDFDAIQSGAKTVDLREKDRDYAIGDSLRLREWNPDLGTYTGRAMRVTVTHVWEDAAARWIQSGVVALSLGDAWIDHDPPTTRIINLRDPAAVEAAKADGTYVRVDRRTRWGNPFKMGPGVSRYDAIRQYAAHLKTRPDLLADLPTLKGKALACWCAPDACHAEVLRAKVEEGPEAVSISEMVGICPDMTGGLSTEEYIRRLWEGDAPAGA